MNDLIIIGASGHGQVVADIAIKNNCNILGFLDDKEEIQEVMGIKVIGKVKDILKYQDISCFIIAIGSNEIRKMLCAKYDVKWSTLIHPTAVIANDVKIDEGTVVMANVVVNPNADIGRHCIINTGAIVEHEDVIGDYVHISPKCVLGGNVRIGEGCHIGIGATVKNNVRICCDSVIGAGGVVVKDVDEVGVYVGVPVKKIS